jgi:hypothetical protein
MRSLLRRLRECRDGTLAERRKGTYMAVEWQISVVEAREATGFTGEDISRSVNAIGEALRLDHRGDFYAELGSLSDSGRFDAFLNHWWTQALADSAANEETRQAAIDFADVAVSLYARAVGGPTSTQEQVEALTTGSEVS